jgi:hypothetical protein
VLFGLPVSGSVHRSGLNLSASGPQNCGLRLVAQGTSWIPVPFGTNWSKIVVSRVASRIVIGTVGYRRIVSLQTPFRSGSDSKIVAKSTSDPGGDGTLDRTSSRNLVWISGWIAKRYVTQVNADEVVSWLLDVRK